MTDTNTPDWLREAEPAPAPAPTPAVTTVAPPPPPPTNGTAVESTTTTTDEADLPSMILLMRLANMGVAVAMIVISILAITGIPAISTLVLSIYAICGGLLICCLETQLKFVRVMIALNFGFLFHSTWRFLFYLLMASIAYSFKNILGTIVGISWVVVACFNTYVLCRYPSYRKVRDQIAEEEDKRIEARISKEVRRQAARQVAGGI